jgi:hypothetical protein
MSIVQDIITTYRKPQQVFAGLLDGEVSESRTLAILMGGLCWYIRILMARTCASGASGSQGCN